MKNSPIQVFADFSSVTAVHKVNDGGFLGSGLYREPVDLNGFEAGQAKIVDVGAQTYILNNTGGDPEVLNAARGLKTAFVLSNTQGQVVDLSADGVNVHPASADSDFQSKPEPVMG